MTTVSGLDWRTKPGDRLFIDGEEIGRAAAIDVKWGEEAKRVRVDVIPELLYWERVLGKLTSRTLPGHEPGIPMAQCTFCAGSGQLVNIIGERYEVVDCKPCDGMGWHPRTRVFSVALLRER